MITLFTDFGHDGLYVGQMHAVIGATLPTVRVVDLCHTIPRQNITSAAYLLPAYTHYLPPASVTIAVIDPGVGSDRPHAVCEADGRWFIGPDNGLFDVLAQQAGHFKKYHFKWPGQVSSSFHGRDIYTPAACLLVDAGALDVLPLEEIEQAEYSSPPDLAEVVYFDHFGNAITGYRHASISAGARVEINGHELAPASTFADVEEGRCFCYENATGLLEIAANQGSARDILGLQLGSRFSIN